VNKLLPDEIIPIHRALLEGDMVHAFGGAIALAYWAIPRYTHDVDINIALPGAEHRRVLDALATLFPLPDRAKAERTWQPFPDAYALGIDPDRFILRQHAVSRCDGGAISDS
jgi:hypothetical protein